jgi:hypothetical protein
MTAMPPEEINAKALIAAALIQSGHIGESFSNVTLNAPWVESEQLMRLHMLTQRVYDAITSQP